MEAVLSPIQLAHLYIANHGTAGLVGEAGLDSSLLAADLSPSSGSDFNHIKSAASIRPGALRLLSDYFSHQGNLGGDPLKRFVETIEVARTHDVPEATVEALLGPGGPSAKVYESLFSPYKNASIAANPITSFVEGAHGLLGASKPVQSKIKTYRFYRNQLSWLNSFASVLTRVSTSYDRPFAIGASNTFERLIDFGINPYRSLDFHVQETMLDSWKLNSFLLELEIQRGRPIADLDGVTEEGEFINNDRFSLGAERTTLAQAGYTFDKATSLWIPPGWNFHETSGRWLPDGWTYDESMKQWHPDSWRFNESSQAWLPPQSEIGQEDYLQWQAPGWVYDKAWERWRPSYLEIKRDSHDGLIWQLDQNELQWQPKVHADYAVARSVYEQADRPVKSVDTGHGVSITGDKPRILERVQSLLASGSIQDLAENLIKAYPEIEWLALDANDTPEDRTAPREQLVSEKLFSGVSHPEFDKCVMGIQSLVWVLHGDASHFVMSPENFQKLRRQTLKALGAEQTKEGDYSLSAEALNMTFTTLVVRDLEKVKNLIQRIVDETGIMNLPANASLAELLDQYPNRVYSFDRLTPEHQETVLKSLVTGYNHGHLFQAEGIAANLNLLKGMDETAWNQYYLHWIYDLAGVKGHVNQDSVFVLTDDYIRYLEYSANVWKMANDPGTTLEETYRYYLGKRAEELGWQIDSPKFVALTRLACQMRISEKKEAEQLKVAFENLPPETRSLLIEELCEMGVGQRHGILIYHSPALFFNTLDFYKEGGEARPIEKTVQVAAEVLARIYALGRAFIADLQRPGVTILKATSIAAAMESDPDHMHEKKLALDALRGEIFIGP